MTVFYCRVYTASQEDKYEWEVGQVWKLVIMPYFQIISRQSSGQTRQNQCWITCQVYSRQKFACNNCCI